LRRGDGRLGVAQLLPGHVAGVRGPLRARDLVRRGARDRQPRSRACDRPGAPAPAGALRPPPQSRGRLGVIATPPPTPVTYLESRQASNGGFAEPGGSASPQLTAWAVLGLRSTGARPGPAVLAYLQAHEGQLADATDVELAAMAESVLGARADRLLARIGRLQHRNGAIGPNVNSTTWGILALRQAGRRAPRRAVRYLLRHQARSGGWSWY